MKFLIATKNYKKLRELTRVLQPLGVEAVTDAELGFKLNRVEETGDTFRKNARLKAENACRQSGVPSIADDSGLVVDALDGAPGVKSARYAGVGASDVAKNEKLLKELINVSEETRTARFVTAICCAFPSGDIIEAEGTCEGRIGFAPVGENGFGYDPLFVVSDGQTYAEMSDSAKDAISHRGQALRKFAVLLQDYL